MNDPEFDRWWAGVVRRASVAITLFLLAFAAFMDLTR